MKKLLITSILFLCFGNGHTQMHSKTKMNIGVLAGGGNIYTGTKSVKSSRTNNFGYELGLTSNIYKFLYGEVKYQHYNRLYNFSSSEKSDLQNPAIALNINAKNKFYVIATGKSNRQECRGIIVRSVLGFEYAYHMLKAQETTQHFPQNNDFHVEAGISLSPSFSGGAKIRQAWTYFFDFIYRYDLNKDKFPISPNSWNNHYIGLRLIVLHHKTRDFLDIH